MSKTTRTESNRRVKTVYKLLLKGVNPVDIQQWCAENFNIKPRQARKYIASARKMLQADSQRQNESEFGKALARLDKLYQIAVAEGRLQIALAVQRETNALLKMQRAYQADQEENHNGLIPALRQFRVLGIDREQNCEEGYIYVRDRAELATYLINNASEIVEKYKGTPDLEAFDADQRLQYNLALSVVESDKAWEGRGDNPEHQEWERWLEYYWYKILFPTGKFFQMWEATKRTEPPPELSREIDLFLHLGDMVPI
jgi:hypothetical protein